MRDWVGRRGWARRDDHHGAVVLAGLLAVSVATGGCLEPTQIELLISTDVACGDSDDIGITVATPEQAEWEPVVTVAGCKHGKVGSLVLIPADEKDAAVGIKVVRGVETESSACQPLDYSPPTLDSGCIVARRALSFVPHTPLELPIHLHDRCIGVPCTADTTCVDGECRHRWVPDGDRCAGGSCHEGLLPACEVTHPCPGDVTMNGTLDLADLSTIVAHRNTRCGDPNFNPAADVTKDYEVNSYDALLVRVLYGCDCDEQCSCPTTHPCPGDADGDGYVGEADLALVNQAMFTQCGEEDFNPTADFDDDDIVDGSDFNIWNESKFSNSACIDM